MSKLLSLILLVFLIGCREQPAVYHYTEEVIEAPVAAMPAGSQGSAQRGRLMWDVPAGWVEQGATALRLATFHAATDPGAFDCSIVALQGEAGGLEANIRRWLGQAHIVASDDDIRRLLAESTDHVFDFTTLQQGKATATPSMIAAALELDGRTVFVKLTGSIAAVHKYKADFLSLVKSVRLP